MRNPPPKVPRLIRITDRRVLDLSEAIYRVYGPLIYNQQLRLVCKARHFELQFSLSAVWESPIAVSARIPWTDPPVEMDSRDEIQIV